MQYLPINPDAMTMLLRRAPPEGMGDRVRLLWSDDGGANLVSTEFATHDAGAVLRLLTASTLADFLDEARMGGESESTEGGA